MATRRLCSIPDCGKQAYARGWCNSHYHRWQRYGDPLTRGRNNHGEARRFYTEVVLTHDGDDCLIWPYCKSASGYAHLRDKGKTNIVARMICEHAYGAPPTSKHEAAHSCGKGHEGCVNRRHLRWATLKENRADRIKHGSWGKMITEETARQMLSLKGILSVNEISVRFGVHPSVVYPLFAGRSWKHLTSGQAPTRS